MKITILTLSALAFLSTSTFAETKLVIPTKEASSIFKAAGFTKTKTGWKGNCDAGEITTYKDINGDGLKDAIISDSSTMCYGNTGIGYYIVAQQKNGQWKTILKQAGMPEFLKLRAKMVGQILKMVVPVSASEFYVGLVRNIKFTAMNIRVKAAH